MIDTLTVRSWGLGARFASPRHLAVLGIVALAVAPAAAAPPWFSLPESFLEVPQDPDSALTDHEEFGRAVAVGDFNDDGFDDLAVGAPRSDVGFNHQTGLVDVYYGSAAGLERPRALQLSAELNLPQPCTFVADDDAFGYALAVGDFDHDGFDDLAVGIPGREVTSGGQTFFDAGAVQLFWGEIDDLDGSRVLEIGPCLARGDAIVAGATASGERFGLTIARGDFDSNYVDDLAIGAPEAEVGGLPGAGEVVVLYGSFNRTFGARAPQVWNLAHPDLGGAASGDRFGTALAAGDLVEDSDRRCDLAIGIPGRDDTVVDEGAVQVVYGCSSTGLATGVAPRLLTAADLSGVVPLAAEMEAGSALAIGNFDCQGPNDLAVGAPLLEPAVFQNVGAVWLFYGPETPSVALIRDLEGPFTGDGALGSALLAIPTDTACENLAVGAPGRGETSTKTVILAATPSGISGSIHQEIRGGMAGSPEPNSSYGDGWSLALGRFDGERRSLVAGRLEHWDTDLSSYEGAVWVLPEIVGGLFFDGFESGDLGAWSQP